MRHTHAIGIQSGVIASGFWREIIELHVGERRLDEVVSVDEPRQRARMAVEQRRDPGLQEVHLASADADFWRSVHVALGARRVLAALRLGAPGGELITRRGTHW